MTYVVGDVHGNLKTLQNLISKAAKNSNFIFVGDLVDRGKYSKEVIKLIRENNYACVLGNHEKMMIEYGEVFVKTASNPATNYINVWFRNGGKETLLSYDLIKIVDNQVIYTQNKKALDIFENDINYLKTLPLYLELNTKINDRKIVISHSCISNVWHKKDDFDFIDEFEEYALWYRDEASTKSNIFNIFGHTPVPFGVDIKEHYINLDTGCYVRDDDLGALSAFCIETNEILSIRRNKED